MEIQMNYRKVKLLENKINQLNQQLTSLRVQLGRRRNLMEGVDPQDFKIDINNLYWEEITNDHGGSTTYRTYGNLKDHERAMQGQETRLLGLVNNFGLDHSNEFHVLVGQPNGVSVPMNKASSPAAGKKMVVDYFSRNPFMLKALEQYNEANYQDR